MTEEEIIHRNLILSTEFDRYVMEHQEFADKIPANALIVLLPEYDPELCRINTEIAERQKEEGQQIVYVHVGRIAPQVSRLENVSMEVRAA